MYVYMVYMYRYRYNAAIDVRNECTALTAWLGSASMPAEWLQSRWIN